MDITNLVNLLGETLEKQNSGIWLNQSNLNSKQNHGNGRSQLAPVNLKGWKLKRIQWMTRQGYDNLGPAMILWLRLVIEQQARRRRIRETDATIAKWLKTSRATISKYKAILKHQGFLIIDTSHKVQRLSVRFFRK